MTNRILSGMRGFNMIEMRRRELSQFEFKRAHHANFFHRRACRTIGSGLVAAVAPEDLDHAVIGGTNLTDLSPRVGGELLGDAARVVRRLGEQLRPQFVELGNYVARICGRACALADSSDE